MALCFAFGALLWIETNCRTPEQVKLQLHNYKTHNCLEKYWSWLLSKVKCCLSMNSAVYLLQMSLVNKESRAWLLNIALSLLSITQITWPSSCIKYIYNKNLRTASTQWQSLNQQRVRYNKSIRASDSTVNRKMHRGSHQRTGV